VIPAHILMTPRNKTLENVEKKTVPLLSIILFCRLSEDEISSKALVTHLSTQRKDVELIVVVEPSSIPSRSQLEFTSWFTKQGCRVIVPDSPCGLVGIRLNEGILASHGQWIWLVDAQHPMPTLDLAFILNILTGLPGNTIPILVHPGDQEQFLNIPASNLLWVDLFYKGWQFPFENIFFPRSLFDTFGLLDPHLVMAQFFQQEFLFRICRHIQFKKVNATDTVPRLCQKIFPSIFYYWVDVDRQRLLIPNNIYDYIVDDLEQFHSGIPKPERWNAYLNYVLPYYYYFRELLPDGLPEKAQSLPPVTRHILCTKSNHYDTTTDVGVRNFDVFAQGERFFKLSYIYSSQIEANTVLSNDALLLLRIVDATTLDLAKKGSKAGLPVGYALDDDLLNLFQDDGEFANFRAGDPFYDAMVDTIKCADVVLCGGPHVQKAVQHLNRRTVHFEGAVLPQFLPENTFRNKKIPFNFGYAGGRYRIEEMQMLWPAIERICQEYNDRVQFEFWGLDPCKLPVNLRQVSFQPFSISYFEYLARLKESGFDAMIVPLFQQSLHRRGKLPNKLYETTVAGAVGLYSDVPTYNVVKKNMLGLIVGESTEAWYDAMRSVLEMPEKKYLELYARSQAFVKEFYTTPSMLPVHEHGLEAILFHGSTGAARSVDGRPVVVYGYPDVRDLWDSDVQFKRLLELAEKSAISPLVIMPNSAKDLPEFESLQNFLDAHGIPYDFSPYHSFTITSQKNGILPFPEEEASIRYLLMRQKVALVHTIGYSPVFGKVCSDLGIPHISLLPSISDHCSLPVEQRFPFRPCTLVQSESIHSAQRWGHFFKRHWFCARGVVSESFYEIGFGRLYSERSSLQPNDRIRIGIVGSLIYEKYQLEIIQAISRVVEFGFNIQLEIFANVAFQSDFYDRFQGLISKLKMGDRFFVRGGAEDLKEVYSTLDIFVSTCRSDIVPLDAMEAMASGTLVVLIQVEDKPELMRDGVNGILISDSEPKHISEGLLRAINLEAHENLRLRRNAFYMTRQEFHFRRGLSDLLSMYNLCLQIHTGKASGQPISQTEISPNLCLVASTPTSPGSHLRLSDRLTYHIVPQHSKWMGLDVLVGAHRRPDSGALRLQVLSEIGKLLREVSVDLCEARHNNWFEFRFDPIENTCGRSFTLEFAVMNSKPKILIRLYESNPPEIFLRRILRRAGLLRSGNSLYCSMRYLEKE
jgi:O-antigen biosynthesis protein